jgi:hypothetical protein
MDPCVIKDAQIAVSLATMDPRLMKDAKLKQAIIHHTQLGISIRKKLKVMIHKLPVPDLVERNILNFIGAQKYKY